MTNLSNYRYLGIELYEDWQQSQFQLVSLMTLLRFKADAFCRVGVLLGQCIAFLHDDDRGINDEVMDGMGRSLEELGGELEKLELRSTLQQLARTREYISSHSASSVSLTLLKDQLGHLVSRMIDDLEAEVFLSVPFKRVSYYEQEAPLFGDLVETRFPRLTEDISEAGKCLALNRYTAAVFHLMRVMEAGVQEFGNRLGVPLVHQKEWHKILTDINGVIKNMTPKKDPLAKVYAEAAAHLYNVKVAWRNEVMHPKDTYTEEEADNIFQNVKAFIVDLAQMI